MESNVPQVESNRLKGQFCSDVVFNLSGKVLTDLEIKVLGKGLMWLRLILSMKLTFDFKEFCRKMIRKCKLFLGMNLLSILATGQLFVPSLHGNLQQVMQHCF